jgi:hypothetical protein
VTEIHMTGAVARVPAERISARAFWGVTALLESTDHSE